MLLLRRQHPTTWVEDNKTYSLYAIDAAGNLSTVSATTFTSDITSPTITSVSTSTGNGTKKITDPINFTLNLSEAAVFTANGGSATIPMNLTSGGPATASISVDNALLLRLWR